MQKKKNLVKLTAVLFILAVCWLFFIFSKKIVLSNEGNTTYFIPKDAIWAIELNTRSIIDKGVQSVLFSDKQDKELNKLINELTESSKSKRLNIDDLGINLNANVYLFKIKKNNNDFTCFMFKLSSPLKFNQNVGKILPENYNSFYKNKIGLIIYGQNGNQQILANEILNRQGTTTKSTPFNVKVNTRSTSFSSEVNISILDSSLLFEGKCHVLGDNIAPNVALKPNGFHFTTRYVPKEISDTICTFFGIEKNQLIGASMNHSSSEIINQPKLFLKLNSSILFHFKESINIRSLIQKIGMNEKAMNVDSTSFVIGESKYYFHQFSPNSFYLGNQIFEKSQLTKREDIFYLTGNPSSITNIKGEGIVRRFIGVIPLFYASEKILNSIEIISLSSKSISSERNKIQGVIRFKNGKKSMNELLKFVLLLNEK